MAWFYFLFPFPVIASFSLHEGEAHVCWWLCNFPRSSFPSSGLLKGSRLDVLLTREKAIIMVSDHPSFIVFNLWYIFICNSFWAFYFLFHGIIQSPIPNRRSFVRRKPPSFLTGLYVKVKVKALTCTPLLMVLNLTLISCTFFLFSAEFHDRPGKKTKFLSYLSSFDQNGSEEK